MPNPQSELPDDALVVRGGKCLPENFAEQSGVSVEEHRVIDDVSVNSYPGLSIRELAERGIPHTWIGATTVGEIRKAGGAVTPSPRKKNPYHATLSGLTPEQASRLFQPVTRNPNQSS